MLALFLYFVLLSLLAVGGVNTILPEMQRIVVETEAWMTGAEFTQLYAIAGFCLPAGALAYWVGGVWDRFRDAPWRKLIQRALLPVTVGLVFAGGYLLATPDGLDWRNALIAIASATVLCTTRLNPLWILSGGAIAGYLLYA